MSKANDQLRVLNVQVGVAERRLEFARTSIRGWEGDFDTQEEAIVEYEEQLVKAKLRRTNFMEDRR